MFIFGYLIFFLSLLCVCLCLKSVRFIKGVVNFSTKKTFLSFFKEKNVFLCFFFHFNGFFDLRKQQKSPSKKNGMWVNEQGRKHVLLPNLAKLFATTTNRVAIAMAVTDLAAAVNTTLLLLNLCYIIYSLKRKMLVCMWRSIELRAHHIRCLKMILHVSAYGFLSFFHSFTISKKDCLCAESAKYTLNV